MVLEPFAFLCAKPVHEEPELPVNLGDGYRHYLALVIALECGLPETQGVGDNGN